MKRHWDVVIAGAGPAGLSAALVLGRACRTVLLCDTGTPRSWAAKEMHAFLSRDGIVPARFRELSRQEVLKYPGVTFAPVEVRSARRVGTGFEVRLGEGRPVRCRKLLIATGVYDLLPPLRGIEPLYGRSVFQCPYCDGWEVSGQRIAVYGRRQRGLEMSRAMTAWARDIVLCTDGRAGYTAAARRDLQRNGITIVEKPVAELRGANGRLSAVVFEDGEALARDALFFDTPSRPQSKLAQSVGCEFRRNGGVLCGDYEATSVPGVFVAGNITRDVQLSIVAAAEGARAAFGINRSLTREDYERRATGRQRIQHPATPVAS
ncbi:MAG TPA: NAD(P)/FAD-dependent oxidoreductase [Vicinamibacterales bacterium]|nr:NAD(P)/FAD-dependent oxidoreductase [Vicinamibacterales bacterium]